MKHALFTSIITAFFLLLPACEHTGVVGNEGGSAPVNETEAKEYQKAILKCYRLGGSRIVKITGELRCY